MPLNNLICVICGRTLETNNNQLEKYISIPFEKLKNFKKCICMKCVYEINKNTDELICCLDGDALHIKRLDFINIQESESMFIKLNKNNSRSSQI